ncbi:MAG: tagaturonate reductase, partial [Saprospiraceae bacterium]
RAFSNWMIDILNKEQDFDGSVIIIKPTENGDYPALRNQQGRYHIITKGIQNGDLVSNIHQVTSISRIIHPYNEWQQFISTAELELMRFIISNTTESGIRYVEEEFTPDSCPKEFPAKITLWLYHRWQHFDGNNGKGCIILPCELIEDNATKLKECILQHIQNWNLGSGFKEWIINSNYFCNTLVDRIVPGKPKGLQENETLKNDDLLVMAEPYHLWAIEAPDLVKEELPFQETDLNVVFTDDLTPYRKMKVRILNGAHTGMVPVGYLHGLSTVREAVEDDTVGTHIRELLYEEIMPTLDFPKPETEAYIKATIDRFRNPYVDHQLLSISLNSITKFRYRLLPSLLDYVNKFNKIPDRISTSLSSLIIFYLGKYKGETIPRRDDASIIRYFDNLRQDWEVNQQMESVITSILSRADFWGQDLNEIEELNEILTKKVTDKIDY